MDSNNFNDEERKEIDAILSNEIPDYNDYKSSGTVYNDYENNAIKSESNSKGIAVILVFGIILIGLVVFTFLNINIDLDSKIYDEYYDNEAVAEEEFYLEEYDQDNDGTLAYEERDVYINNAATIVSNNCKITEIYRDEDFGILYFLIEGLNNKNFISTEFQIAFFDENGRLQGVEEDYIYNGIEGEEIIVEIRYDKSFNNYDCVVNLDGYTYTEYPSRRAKLEVKNEYWNSELAEFSIDVVNLNDSNMHGEIYAIFYDANGKVIRIESIYVYDIEPGKTNREYLALEPDFTYDSVKFITSDVQTENY